MTPVRPVWTILLSSLPAAVLGCAPIVDGVGDADVAAVIEPAAALSFFVCHDGTGSYSTIQDAVEDVPSGSVVVVCAGVYEENVTVDGTALTLVPRDGAGTVTIDAGTGGRALAVSNVPAPGFGMSGFVIQGGETELDGAGLWVSDSVVTLEDNRFTGNDSDGDGGGLYAATSEITFTGNSFDDNLAMGLGGGAAFDGCSGTITGNTFEGNDADMGGGLAVSGDELSVLSNVIIANSSVDVGGGVYIIGDSGLLNNSISDNHADDHGGGFYVTDGSGLVEGNRVTGNTTGNDGAGGYITLHYGEVTGNSFEGNEASDDAGGLRVRFGYLDITYNDFLDNIARDAGGAIKLSHAESEFSFNLVRGNVAGDRGGGIELDNDNTSVNSSVFEDNAAARGGGLHSMNNTAGFSIRDSTFEGNTASYAGGGLMLEDDGFTVRLGHLEFYDNSAPDGAGIYVGLASIQGGGLILAGNVASDRGGALYLDTAVGRLAGLVAWGNEAKAAGAAIDANDSSAVSFINAIISANAGSAAVQSSGGRGPAFRYSDVWGNVDGDFSGMRSPIGRFGNIGADPVFTDPGTFDFTLATGSPAIDAGVPFLRDGDGSRSDMGAFGGPYGSW